MSKQQRNPEDFCVITISQQIADLKQSLSSHQSPIGDWKGIKQEEYIKAGLTAPYTSAQMQEYYQKRIAARNQINQLEKQLEEERAGNVGGNGNT